MSTEKNKNGGETVKNMSVAGEASSGSAIHTPTRVCLVLAEPETMEVAAWVRDIVAEHLSLPLSLVALRNVGPSSGGDDRFRSAALSALDDVTADIIPPTAGGDSSTVTAAAKKAKVNCLVVAVFWDGQGNAAKVEFTRLRQLAEVKKNVNANVTSGKSMENGEVSMSPKGLQLSEVQFTVQALNAKKGEHTLKENSTALVNSLCKTFAPKDGGRHVDPQNCEALSSSTQRHATVSSGTPSASCEAKGTVMGKEDLSKEAIAKSMEEGQGECFILVSGRTMEEFQKRVEELKASAKSLDAGCRPLIDEPREAQVPSGGNANTRSSGGGGSNGAEMGGSQRKTSRIVQEFIVRQSESGMHIELRIAMCGNVDSGKSTLTSVLTRGCRDDGRGSARAFVFKHKHEAQTGRTSSISDNLLGLSSMGEVVNYTIDTRKRLGGGGNALSTQKLAQEVVAQSAKVLTLYDLAGHERYLKTTVLGMTRNMPDYACVVISANNGIQRMTKEHISLCLALKVPFFVVVTRIDSTPDNVRQETLASIHKLLKIPTVRKLPCPVRRDDDIVLFAKNLRLDRIVPIFEVSNVTGDGIQTLIRFLDLIPARKDWRLARTLPREMVIDSTFSVNGVGTVVGGIVTQGVFRVNDAVLLGPDGHGAFRTTFIKSIQVRRIDEKEVAAGCDATFVLKKEERKDIRKGNILVDPNHPVVAYWQFEADVMILYHSTTIQENYEPVVHSVTVRQSARIVYVAQKTLRTGDRSIVRFQFVHRPEFMKVGQKVIFREGRTKGIGTVTQVIAEKDESKKDEGNEPGKATAVGKNVVKEEKMKPKEGGKRAKK